MQNCSEFENQKVMDFLPLFPLQLVVFPGEYLNLHIFEPRYKQLIRECEENGVSFGIPAYLDGKVMPIGTEIQLTKVEKKYDNGSLDIKTRGVGVFEIKQFYNPAPNKLYPGGDIIRRKETVKGDIFDYSKILDKMEILYELMDIQKKIPESPAEFNIFQIAHHIGLPVNLEYKILELKDEKERQSLVLSHFEQLLPIAQEMYALKQKAKLNGHFKNIVPPKI